jgi:hypothetical protein
MLNQRQERRERRERGERRERRERRAKPLTVTVTDAHKRTWRSGCRRVQY